MPHVTISIIKISDKAFRKKYTPPSKRATCPDTMPHSCAMNESWAWLPQCSLDETNQTYGIPIPAFIWLTQQLLRPRAELKRVETKHSSWRLQHLFKSMCFGMLSLTPLFYPWGISPLDMAASAFKASLQDGFLGAMACQARPRHPSWELMDVGGFSPRTNPTLMISKFFSIDTLQIPAVIKMMKRGWLEIICKSRFQTANHVYMVDVQWPRLIT